MALVLQPAPLRLPPLQARIVVHFRRGPSQRVVHGHPSHPFANGQHLRCRSRAKAHCTCATRCAGTVEHQLRPTLTSNTHTRARAHAHTHTYTHYTFGRGAGTSQLVLHMVLVPCMLHVEGLCPVHIHMNVCTCIHAHVPAVLARTVCRTRCLRRAGEACKTQHQRGSHSPPSAQQSACALTTGGRSCTPRGCRTGCSCSRPWHRHACWGRAPRACACSGSAAPMRPLQLRRRSLSSGIWHCGTCRTWQGGVAGWRPRSRMLVVCGLRTQLRALGHNPYAPLVAGMARAFLDVQSMVEGMQKHT